MDVILLKKLKSVLFKAQGSMGQNSPSKFSASKLFGFGGESKKEQETSPAFEERNNPSNFSNSFSTQAIKMETKLEVFKKDDPTPPSYNFDEEPILAGNTWDDSNNDATIFNDTEEEEEEENEEEQKGTKSSDVIGFDEDF